MEESTGSKSTSNYPARKGYRWPFRTSERRALLVVADLALVSVAIFLGLWLWQIGTGDRLSVEFMLGQVYWFPALTALWGLASVLNGFYDANVTANPRRTARALVQLAAILLVVYLLIYFFSSPGSLPRRFVLYFVATSFVLLGTWRAVYIAYLGLSPFQRRAVIVGSPEQAARIAEVIRSNAMPHYRAVGYISENANAPEEAVEGLPTMGIASELAQKVESLAVSEVIVTSMADSDGTLVRSLIDCQEQGVQITPAPSLYEELTGRVSVDMVANGWLDMLPLQHASTGVIFPLVKRFIDIALAILGLIVLGLMLPFIAPAVRLDSPGPLFYIQRRAGKGGRVFRAFKFRSMAAGSADDLDGELWTDPSDPRVTRVGRFLRATHIDEFPQLLNILKGDMSTVGPRPERSELVVRFERAIPYYRLRHSVRPGMAGWALVNQGNTNSVEDALIKLEYDLYYIKHQSLWLDLVILLRTFADTLAFRGR